VKGFLPIDIYCNFFNLTFFQKLLSKRLLQTWYSEKSEAVEIRNLELLKMRFGEDDMNKCEVMLKVGFYLIVTSDNW